MNGEGGAVGRLRRLRGVRWRWRDDAPASARQTAPMGVIAQDVEAVFPELVTTDANGHKRVAYTGLIGPLIEAVKELDERLRAVEARLEAIEAGERPSRNDRRMGPGPSP